MKDLSYKISGLNYWNIGEKYQIYAFMYWKVTFKSVLAKKKDKRKKAPNLVLFILEKPDTVTQIMQQLVNVMHLLSTLLVYP